MTDLFAPRPAKPGHANGTFIAKLAGMDPAQRSRTTPADFPEASEQCVRENINFHRRGQP